MLKTIHFLLYLLILSATFYGQAQINGVEADSNDWIAAFDTSECAGASQIINFNSLGYINLVIYGDDPVTPNIDEGITGNEDFFIKIYDASENLYLDFPTYDSIVSFTGWGIIQTVHHSACIIIQIQFIISLIHQSI